MILGKKSEGPDQNSFSFLENINFWKSLPRAPEFEYPPLNTRHTNLNLVPRSNRIKHVNFLKLGVYIDEYLS